MAIPRFLDEAILGHPSQTYRAIGHHDTDGSIAPAGCSYYTGSCAGPDGLSCEFTNTGGICVGPGWAPVVITCDDGTYLSDAWCGA